MRNKYVKICLIIAVLGFLAFAGLGVYDYSKWIKIKKAVAEGGFTYQCGASKIIDVIPLCTETSGGCSCKPCEALCDESTEVDIVPQAVCSTGSLNPAVVCISPEVIALNAKTMGTPLEESAGKQAIFAGVSNMMSGNGVIATPSLGANTIEKIIHWFAYAVTLFRGDINGKSVRTN